MVLLFPCDLTFLSTMPDVDECTHPGVCQGRCHNTDGSSYCDCRNGLRMASDKKSCIGKYMMIKILCLIMFNPLGSDSLRSLPLTSKIVWR